jgi:hypothetical protein
MLTLEGLHGLGGAQVPVRELVELNKALQTQGLYKAGAAAGHPAAMGLGTGAADFTPLIPQSIQTVLDSATFTESMVKFFRMLPKVPVGSTVHEAIVMNEHGSLHLDPFISEGGKNVRSSADYSRKTVNVKYLAELREITDVATMVNTVGGGNVSKQGLALETQAGTTSILGKLERSLFWADSGNSGIHFDGIWKQLTDTTFVGANQTVTPKIGATSSNYEDLQGSAVTSDKLMEALYRVYAAPNYGTPTSILVEPRTYASLQSLAFSKARWGLDAGAPQPITLYNGVLSVAGPTGAVPIISCPLLLPPQTPPTASVPAVDPTGLAAGGVAVVELDAFHADYAGNGSNMQGLVNGVGSKVANTTLGTYRYKIVAVNKNGHGAATTTKFATADDDTLCFRITITDNALTKDNLYYRVYRTGKNEADVAGNYKWAFDAPAKGGAADTIIVDDFSRLPGTAPVFVLQATPDVMCWVQLLDFLRRPLAQTSTSVPFLLMLFGSPFVKVPTKNFVFGNAKLGV